VHVHTYVCNTQRAYTRVRVACLRAGRARGQPAGLAGWRVTFTRSCSLLLARPRPSSCSSFLARKLLGYRSALLNGGDIRGGAVPRSRLAPQSNLNYHFTLPFERAAAAAATAETRTAADSPAVYLSSAPSFFPFSSCFSLPLSLPPDERRTLVPEIDEVAHRARAPRKRRAF